VNQKALFIWVFICLAGMAYGVDDVVCISAGKDVSQTTVRDLLGSDPEKIAQRGEFDPNGLLLVTDSFEKMKICLMSSDEQVKKKFESLFGQFILGISVLKEKYPEKVEFINDLQEIIRLFCDEIMVSYHKLTLFFLIGLNPFEVCANQKALRAFSLISLNELEAFSLGIKKVWFAAETFLSKYLPNSGKKWVAIYKWKMFLMTVAASDGLDLPKERFSYIHLLGLNDRDRNEDELGNLFGKGNLLEESFFKDLSDCFTLFLADNFVDVSILGGDPYLNYWFECDQGIVKTRLSTVVRKKELDFPSGFIANFLFDGSGEIIGVELGESAVISEEEPRCKKQFGKCSLQNGCSKKMIYWHEKNQRISIEQWLYAVKNFFGCDELDFRLEDSVGGRSQIPPRQRMVLIPKRA